MSEVEMGSGRFFCLWLKLGAGTHPQKIAREMG